MRPVDPQQDFPSLEEAVLARWRERDVFHESQRRRAGAPRYVFYEGPPTANGRPGSHHVLSRVFKDIFPRYQTMQGKLVERRGGWDTHGLPVELAVEQQLGIGQQPGMVPQLPAQAGRSGMNQRLLPANGQRLAGERGTPLGGLQLDGFALGLLLCRH